MHVNPHQQARRLRALLQKSGHTLSYTQAQQLVARSLGFSAWQELILHDDTRPAAPAPRLAYVLTVISEREQERGNSQDMWELLARSEADRQALDTVIAKLIRHNPQARVYTLLEPRMIVMRDSESYDTVQQAADTFFAAAGDHINTKDEGDPDALGTCAECGQPYGADPDGSEGVLVHRDENGDPDYDQDRDHVPVPEDD